jgi:hypothetical protein
LAGIRQETVHRGILKQKVGRLVKFRRKEVDHWIRSGKAAKC